MRFNFSGYKIVHKNINKEAILCTKTKMIKC